MTSARGFGRLALLILPMLMLSGGETPVEGQPGWLQVATLLLPSRHFMACSQAIVYKGAGLDVVWPEILSIALLGTLLLALSLLVFRRSISQSG